MLKGAKVAVVNALLVSYIFLPLCTCQQIATQTGTFGSAVPNTQFHGTGTSISETFVQGGVGAAPVSTGFEQGGVGTARLSTGFVQGGVGAVPNSWSLSNNAARGYSNTPIVPTTYMSAPLHGQFWTGQYPQYNQQYGNYYQSGFGTQYGNQQYGSNYYSTGVYPQQHYYTQQYPAYYQYGPYQRFDAGYWTGHFYPQHVPMYQPYPMYQGGMVYPGQYVQHPYYPGAYPRPHKPFYKKGFLGGTGNGLAKTLLGAVVVGTVAKAVARG